MIIGNKNNIPELKPYVSPRLYKALEYLANTDFSSLENGQYEIEGRTIYAGVNTYETEARELKKPETHDKYIDVQFLGRGHERVYVCPKEPCHVVSEDYSAERDVVFYAKAEERDCANLGDGAFVIVFPWEIHRPGCNSGNTSEEVQKIVVKVLAE